MPQIVASILATTNWQRIRHFTYIITFSSCVIGAITVLAGFVFTGQAQSYMQKAFDIAMAGPEPVQSNGPDNQPAGQAEKALFSFSELNNHPDQIHGAYTSDPLISLGNQPIHDEHLTDFRDLLGIYVARQAEDDNFTVRVIDRRTSGLLERYTLTDLKAEYEATGYADWAKVDAKRGSVGGRLVGKYRRRGVPVEDIMIKWGRLDQVKEARMRDEPFISYEIRLSQMLNLSLLSTELGTVETFNDDKLVSTVGARSRYQIMPYMLRKFDIHSYTLRTPTGQTVSVHEEWHPLLTMEASFTIIKSYSNAVGHEIPGISAYHTGPFNIFKIYNMYLQQEQAMFNPSATVMDAYIWALTEGFDQVAEDSGFRKYSRSYIPTAYGSLKGAELLPVDESKTEHVERVQTRVNERLQLSELLAKLAELDERHPLDWGRAGREELYYNRFKALNPHIDLPALDMQLDSSVDDALNSLPTPAPMNAKQAGSAELTVPRQGDILLTTRSKSQPVRFFLPLDAADRLMDVGLDVFDTEETFRFDDATFTQPEEKITVWDKQYDALVDDIKHFGFSRENRTRLYILTDRFAKLYKADPSHYRWLQLRIIKMHKGLWQTRYWGELAKNTSAASTTMASSPMPPAPMGLTPRMSFSQPVPTQMQFADATTSTQASTATTQSTATD